MPPGRLSVQLTILGGGGFRVPLVHRALLARKELGIEEVVLHDVDPARLAVIAAVLPVDPDVRVRTTESLIDALTGADFVFSAIRVGGAAGRVRDERRALRLGLLGQETVGAGGLAFGLRTLPVALQAAQVQAEVAPAAWLINFTNPAGLITQALTAVLADKVIGICDSPIGLVRRTCRALGLPDGQVGYDYAGINHLGWLTRLEYQGRDRLPDLLADDDLLATTEEGRLFGPELLRSLRCIPNEYLYFYYAAGELVDALTGSPTRGEVVEQEQREFYRAAASDAGGAAALWQQARAHREASYLAEARDSERDAADLTGGGYEHVALDIVEAVQRAPGSPPARLLVNAANGAAYPQLPSDLVIETRCRVDGTGAHPEPGPPLRLHRLGLVASVRAAEAEIITAVRNRDRAAAVHGFAIHPLIGSRRLATELVRSTEADEPTVAALFAAQ